MKKFLVELAINPMTYLLTFAVLGAASVVSGIGMLAGIGWSLVSLGCFLIAGAAFVARGMSTNG